MSAQLPAANGCRLSASMLLLGLIHSFSAWTCVNAQPTSTISAQTLLPEIFLVGPGRCRKFQISNNIPQRQAYYVLADVTSATGNCKASQVHQSLPQDSEHFGTAEYDSSTTCEEVKEPMLRGQFSAKKEMSLKFFPVSNALSQAVPYVVCADTSWRTGDYQTTSVGPLDTYLFIDNTCTNGTASVAIKVIRSSNVSAEEYCDRLVDQSSGIRTVEILFTVATVMVTLVCCLGIGMCTACCSCWCCCARSGRFATACSRSCHRGCASLTTAAALGWIMDKAGGLTFYSTSQSSSLLFWAFSAACLTTFQIVNLPRFKRDDTLHPERRDSRTTWGPDDVEGIPAVRFLLSLVTSFVYAVAAFGVVPVVFSDAVRDPSFRSKATLAGVLLVATNGVAVCVLLDMYRYYDLWPHKAPQIVLQIGLFVSHFMATLSFVIFVRRATTKRHALRAKLRLNAPQATPAAATDEPSMLPYATVAEPPAHASANVALQPQHGSGRSAGPIAEAAEAAEGSTEPDLDSTEEPPSLGGSATLTLHSPTRYRDGDSHSSSIHDGVASPLRPPPPPPQPPEITGEVLDGDLRRVSGEEEKGGREVDGLAEVGAPSGFESMMPQGPEDLDEAAAAERLSCGAATKAFFAKIWDDVKEEPRIGFRYSVFMSASLWITAVTTTSSLLRAGSAVINLSECTLEGSSCLRDVQRWVYDRFLKSLVRVDADILELQGSGVCAAVQGGDASALLADGAITNLSGDEVLAACRTARALQAAQGEQQHPRWLADAREPVLIGGFAAVISAYCISMYTIYHVARAYKHLEVRLKASRLAELMWQRRGTRLTLPSIGIGTASDTDSSTPPTSLTSVRAGSRPTARKVRAQLGRDILKDYETVSIGQSAYFTGTLVSTCFFQLWLGGAVLGAVLVALLHPSFWRLLRDNIGWVISLAIILAWHVLSQLLLNRYVTDGKRILRPFMWLFAYIGLSAGYCVVAVLLAAVRLVQLLLTSILALSRLDSCLFTVLRGRDRGYASFLAMALMLHSFQQCLKETAAENETEASAHCARLLRAPAPAQHVQERWRSAASRAVTHERTRVAVAGFSSMQSQ
eukprot:jgi/Ulvmu1/6861/UM031_0066.1